MGFTSINFYLALAPVIGAYARIPRARFSILLVTSLCFFLLLSGWPYFFMFCALVAVNFILRTKPLWINLALNLTVLLFFKFKISWFYFSEPGGFYHSAVAGVLLPVGLSFYTFQLMAWQIDSREEKAAERFGEFLLFISFFPQLVAGPIERKAHLVPQLRGLAERTYHFDSDGVLLIAWGLFKKLVVADRAAYVCNILFEPGSRPSGLEALLSGFFFSIQIYCDFSGYTNIALGLGKLFNIQLRENFLSPFTAPTLSSFWRRWHVTLSDWFRDYLYTPLGKTSFALLVVFLLSGLWHGSTPLFLAWGLFHGGLILIRRKLPVKKILPPFAGALLTFLVVGLSWILFRSNSFSQAGEFFHAMLSPSPDWDHFRFRILDRTEWTILIAGGALAILIDHLRMKRTRTFRGWAGAVSFFVLLTAIFFLASPQPRTFIYFHF